MYLRSEGGMNSHFEIVSQNAGLNGVKHTRTICVLQGQAAFQPGARTCLNTLCLRDFQ